LENAIETLGLTKLYGQARGIQNLDLQVRQGEVFGFLGPNGASKTTTIRLLLNLLQPTRGSAMIMGMDVAKQSVDVRRVCGVVSGEPAFFDSLSGRAHLAMMQSYHAKGGSRTEELAERLSFDLDRPVRSYSHGNKQKLAIIQALSHQPQLLILDEPTGGLDPLVQREFYKILAEEKARGVTVFFSSHVLSEVERICDRVGIIREGELVALLDVNDLHKQQVRHMEVTLNRDVDVSEFQLEGVEIVHCEGHHIELKVSGGLGALLQHLAALPVEDIVFPEASLEDTFTEFYSGRGGDE
jgi:ABC-2 type transport system ATP-binding protein